MSVGATATGPGGRIGSMDQFRGYTVAGMVVVNFLGHYAAVHHVFKHNNTHFSYADSIMPSFLFAAGFTYRLTTVRRRAQLGAWPTYRRAAARSLGLILVSLMMFGFNTEFRSWSEMTADGVREFVARLVKADLWEVLAIIGAAQLLLLPVIGAGPRARAAALVGCLVGHAVLSYSFNYDFVNGRPNWMDAYWGATSTRAWDGGAFGLLAWSVPMLAGTLVYDLTAARPPGGAAGSLLGWGLALMALGYGLSCLSRLYDVAPGAGNSAAASSPVLPPWDALRGRPLGSLLADPPFVPPPPDSERRPSYWRMDKRVTSAPFTLFATGFALAAYAAFVVACDRGGLRLGLFRTLGQNPLAAYVMHHAIVQALHAVVPPDSPAWWCAAGAAAALGITYGFVRYLERHNIYVRL